MGSLRDTPGRGFLPVTVLLGFPDPLYFGRGRHAYAALKLSQLSCCSIVEAASERLDELNNKSLCMMS